MTQPKAKNGMFDRLIEYRIRDKDKALRNFAENMLAKTSQIFEYRGLPDSIPSDILEKHLQTNGNIFFVKVNDVLYALTGNLGGELDMYYRPTEYIIANPYLRYSKSNKLGVDGVLMRSDLNMQGVLPLIQKYGTLMVESDISLYNAIINTRDFNTMSAGDDKTRESALEYQRQIEAGYTSVIADSKLLEGLKRHPSPGSSTLRDLRESYQYIKSLLYSDLGMKTASNMKSQYVSDEENIINDDTLIPFIDNMLACRQMALDEINEMFETNIEVKLRGTWELQREEIEVGHVQMEAIINGEEQASAGEEIEVEGDPVEIDESTDPETEETVEAEEAESTPEVHVEINIGDTEEVNVEVEAGSVEEPEEEEDKKEAVTV